MKEIGRTSLSGSVAFSQDGSRIFGLIQNWEGPARLAIWTIDAPMPEPTNHEDEAIANMATVQEKNGPPKSNNLIEPTSDVGPDATPIQLNRHSKPVHCIEWAADGTRFATVSDDGLICVWSADGEKLSETATESVHSPIVTFSRNLDRVAVVSSEDMVPLVKREGGGKVVIYSLPDGNVVSRFDARAPRNPSAVVNSKIHSVVFSPDEKQLVIAGSDESTGHSLSTRKGLVSFWDVATGQNIRRTNEPNFPATALAYSEDGKLLAVGNSGWGGEAEKSGEILIWQTDKDNQRKLHSLFAAPFEIGSPGFAETLAVEQLRFVGDNLIARIRKGNNDVITSWDLKSGKSLSAGLSQPGPNSDYCLSRRGNLLAVQTGKTVTIYRTKSFEEVAVINKPVAISKFAFNPKGTIGAVAIETGAVELRRLGTLTSKNWASAANGEPKTQPVDSAKNNHQKRPNVLFAVAHGWSWPYAGAYGDSVIKTPGFDRIAREGVLMEHAYVSSPSSTPSRGAILSGLHFWNLGSAANLGGDFPDGIPTFPEKLKQAGYHTGFEGRGWGPGKPETPGRELTGKRYGDFAEFLESRPEDTPFCYWLGSDASAPEIDEGAGKAAGIDIDRIVVPEFLPDAEVVRSNLADCFAATQDFDALVQQAYEQLEAAGELDNTIIVVTSDHGMPLPRCVGNLYDSGVRVPMAIRFGKQFPGGRTVSDLTSQVELSSLLLELSGVLASTLDEDRRANGRDLLMILRSKKSGFYHPRMQQRVVFGRERLVPAQEAPEKGGYSSRGLRTDTSLLIHNSDYKNRWPVGTPYHDRAAMPGAWFADTPNSATKSYMVAQLGKDYRHLQTFKAAFEKRHHTEYYSQSPERPHQMENLAGRTVSGAAKQILGNWMRMELAEHGQGNVSSDFDAFPYSGSIPKFDPARDVEYDAAWNTYRQYLESKPASPLAHLKFDSNLKDEVTEVANKLTVAETRFSGNALVLKELSVSKMDPLPFRLHVPRLNYRDFAIAIRFQRKAPGKASPFLTGCNYAPWMKMSFNASGGLSVNVGRQSSNQIAIIEPDKWYDLVCSFNRKAGKANVYLDGKKIRTITISHDEYFEQERSMGNHSGKHLHFWD